MGVWGAIAPQGTAGPAPLRRGGRGGEARPADEAQKSTARHLAAGFQEHSFTSNHFRSWRTHATLEFPAALAASLFTVPDLTDGLVRRVFRVLTRALLGAVTLLVLAIGSGLASILTDETQETRDSPPNGEGSSGWYSAQAPGL